MIIQKFFQTQLQKGILSRRSNSNWKAKPTNTNNKRRVLPTPLNDEQVTHNPSWIANSGVQKYLPPLSRVVCAALKGHAAIVHQQRLPPAPAAGAAVTGPDAASATSAPKTLRRSQFSRPPLRLELGACVLPHDAKVATGGEDAFFATADRRIIGVADGVSSMAMYGIDPKLFPTRLMEFCCQHAEVICQTNPSVPWTESPAALATQTLTYAYGQVLKKEINGASTAVVCALDAHSQRLGFCSLGDSAVIVLRKDAGVGYRLLTRSNDLQHRFNCPYQLSFLEGQVGDSVDSSHVATVEVEEGDLVILGSDGILDNVSVDEMAAIASRALSPSEVAFIKRHATKLAPLCEQATNIAQNNNTAATTANTATDDGKAATDGSSSTASAPVDTNKCSPETLATLEAVEATPPGVLAEALARFAYYRSKRKDIYTPFEERCIKEKIGWRGGKPDDITVLVGWVVGSRTPQNYHVAPVHPPTMTTNVNKTAESTASVLKGLQANRQMQQNANKQAAAAATAATAPQQPSMAQRNVPLEKPRLPSASANDDDAPAPPSGLEDAPTTTTTVTASVGKKDGSAAATVVSASSTTATAAVSSSSGLRSRKTGSSNGVTSSSSLVTQEVTGAAEQTVAKGGVESIPTTEADASNDASASSSTSPAADAPSAATVESSSSTANAADAANASGVSIAVETATATPSSSSLTPEQEAEFDREDASKVAFLQPSAAVGRSASPSASPTAAAKKSNSDALMSPSRPRPTPLYTTPSRSDRPASSTRGDGSKDLDSPGSQAEESALSDRRLPAQIAFSGSQFAADETATDTANNGTTGSVAGANAVSGGHGRSLSSGVRGSKTGGDAVSNPSSPLRPHSTRSSVDPLSAPPGMDGSLESPLRSVTPSGGCEAFAGGAGEFDENGDAVVAACASATCPVHNHNQDEEEFVPEVSPLTAALAEEDPTFLDDVSLAEESQLAIVAGRSVLGANDWDSRSNASSRGAPSASHLNQHSGGSVRHQNRVVAGHAASPSIDSVPPQQIEKSSSSGVVNNTNQQSGSIMTANDISPALEQMTPAVAAEDDDRSVGEAAAEADEVEAVKKTGEDGDSVVCADEEEQEQETASEIDNINQQQQHAE